MPDNMTVEHPHARIVEVELDNEISIRTNKLGVSPLWIAWVDDSSIPGTNTLGEDLHVVAVHVHWM